MKVSIIIPNYNYSRYIRESVDSALAQTYSNKEIILVDDGSTDGSLELLASYGDKINVIAQKNAGVCAARNTGVAHSTGDLIAFLDADDVWLPSKLEKQVSAYKNGESVGLVHVGVEDIDGDGKVIGKSSEGLGGRVSEQLLLFERAVILGGGSGMMVSRQVFVAVSGFDESLSTSGDWDFCYRVCKTCETVFVPEILLQYRLHGNNMHGNIPRMEREMLECYSKAFKMSPEFSEIRNKAYGNLHRVLAGSYFHSGRYGNFIRHTLQSLWYCPANFTYYAAFPLRRFSRRSSRN